MRSEQQDPPEWASALSPAVERRRQFRKRAALLVCATLAIAALLVWGILAMMANHQAAPASSGVAPRGDGHRLARQAALPCPTLRA